MQGRHVRRHVDCQRLGLDHALHLHHEIERVNTCYVQCVRLLDTDLTSSSDALAAKLLRLQLAAARRHVAVTDGRARLRASLCRRLFGPSCTVVIAHDSASVRSVSLRELRCLRISRLQVGHDRSTLQSAALITAVAI